MSAAFGTSWDNSRIGVGESNASAPTEREVIPMIHKTFMELGCFFTQISFPQDNIRTSTGRDWAVHKPTVIAVRPGNLITKSFSGEATVALITAAVAAGHKHRPSRDRRRIGRQELKRLNRLDILAAGETQTGLSNATAVAASRQRPAVPRNHPFGSAGKAAASSAWACCKSGNAAARAPVSASA